MLTLLKKKQPYADAAQRAYGTLLLRTREPAFYNSYGVPDTFDGRFDLLLVHIFILIHRLTREGEPGSQFNQALFDSTFADMDQTLREMGIGDMGVPKHQRRMMKAFNGRMHAYAEAEKAGDGDLAIALRRNLFGTLEDEDVPDLKRIVRYIRRCMTILSQKPADEILKGDIALADVE